MMETVSSSSGGGSRRSFRLLKSERILLSSESVDLECARIRGYERISKSMRLNGECDFSDDDEDDEQRKHTKGMGVLSKLLTFTRTSASSTQEGPKVAAAKKEKKRSSWLPDPQKRWPIQGW